MSTHETSIAVGSYAPNSELECGTSNGALGKTAAQKGNSIRFLVRVTSFRKRLLDEDNICEKYFVDCCRYSGVIPTDAPSQTRIETRQFKTQKNQPESTLVEIWEMT